jgi:hypothetical protein
MPAFEERIANGFLYGDFQFSTDRDSDDFLRKGVFSCYQPVDNRTPVPDDRWSFPRRTGGSSSISFTPTPTGF